MTVKELKSATKSFSYVIKKYCTFYCKCYTFMVVAKRIILKHTKINPVVAAKCFYKILRGDVTMTLASSRRIRRGEGVFF